MAKELLIVFVYDCERCQREEDDPQDAVVYFYPSWVSDQQRLALCGQLMGVTQFFVFTFAPPTILALQSGKFGITKFGRFILCVGTDRNIPDVVLEMRVATLQNLIQLYHRDIEAMAPAPDWDEALCEAISRSLQTFLPILQHAANIFTNIPVLRLPKSASNVFLESIQVLQGFQGQAGVFGGTLLYQNKVVCTQLSPELTRLLVLTDPYRIKMPAQALATEFQLPIGVQLLIIYVGKEELARLSENTAELNASLQQAPQWRAECAKAVTKNGRDSVATGVVCGMKRDVSRIFTVVEEEGEGEEVPDVVRDAVKARRAARFNTVTPASFVLAEEEPKRRPSTTDDVPVPATNNIPIRYYSLGLPQPIAEWCDTEPSSYHSSIKPYYNTIADPTFPLFRCTGLPVSRSLFDAHLVKQFTKALPRHTECREQPGSLEMVSPRRTVTVVTDKQERARRALSLHLSLDKDHVEEPPRRPEATMALTPLMAKLSLLAMEQQKVTDGATQPTPPLHDPLATRQERRRRQPARQRHAKPELEEAILFVCGHQNTTLLLLMDRNAASNVDQVNSMWKSGVSSLNEVEASLHHCLDHVPPTGATSGGESYSFLAVDRDWGATQRGGAWPGLQMELVTTVQHTLATNPGLTDIVIREEESLLYGYQCGHNQVFYQQACSGAAGLPTPSHLMGTVTLKARRRLERDHNIVLL